MKDFKKWKAFLNESSLSRVQQHIRKHESVIMTGFRGDPSDFSRCVDGQSQMGEVKKGKIKQLNILRNRDLKATLLASGYGVTKVDGSYIENFDTPEAMEVSEDSLFVVNLKDDPSFLERMELLGTKFCQDAILVLPRGGKNAYLLGTNNSEFPGLGQKVSVGDVSFGKESEFMTRVGGRPFSTNETVEKYEDLSRNERLAVKNIAKRVLMED